MKIKTQRISIIPAAGICLILNALVAGAAGANDLLGADGFLQAVSAQLAASSSTNVTTTNATELFRADLKAFGQSSTSLTPVVAASQWLALVDRAASLQSRRGDSSASQLVTLEEVLSVLPPPASWSAIASAAYARPAGTGSTAMRNDGLRLLGAALTRDNARRDQELTNVQAFVRSGPSDQAFMFSQIVNEMQEGAFSASDNPDEILKKLEYQVASANADGSGPEVQVPDLVSEIGPAAAEKFLRHALVQPGVVLSFQSVNPTSRLAQKLALELIDQLKQPQWGLVNTVDATDLYEALDKKFNAKPAPPSGVNFMPQMIQNETIENEDGPESQAKAYYLLGLICAGRTTNAVEVAKKIVSREQWNIPDEAFGQLIQAGYGDALDDFLYALLQQNPILPFWDAYIDTAAQAGTTGRMLALARQVAARTDLPEHNSADIKRVLFKALLAADQVDEGVQVMRELMASNAPRWRENAGELAVQVARIGVLTHHPEWISEGVDIARKSLAQPLADNNPYNNTPEIAGALAKLLEEQGSDAEAEEVLVSAVAQQVKATQQQSQRFPGENFDFYGRTAALPQLMCDLALLYHQAGRSADVVALLEKSPYWGARDLHALLDDAAGEEDVNVQQLHGGSSAVPLPYLVASALTDVGRKSEALTVTHAFLQNSPGSDRGYELLLALDPTNALAQMDVLFARDQFEERPLIWKATILKQQGQLIEAEKTVRRAIAIDPSDGEEGRGDRMRAYAVLADIREARGDQKEAQFFREVVKAIRMSEDADQYFLAGLLKQAVAKYEDALNHFSDAYCIQSRLARQLAALGQNDAAAEHYRRAFELMPDSFGRVESHCFGCERAFSGPRAQNIAEQVFTQLAASRPDKPQVYYLLGYLHVEEERYDAARTNFETAVRLDPDYLNAWGKLNEVTEHVLIPASERDDIQINILRLDPQNRHSYPSFQYISDLNRLWDTVAEGNRHRPPAIGDLLALPASAAAMKKPDGQEAGAGDRFNAYEEYEERPGSLTPAGAVSQTAYVKLAGTVLDTSVSMESMAN